MIFFHLKPPILWIFEYFSNKNGQICNFLGIKLLKIIKISKNIPSPQVQQIKYPVALCNRLAKNKQILFDDTKKGREFISYMHMNEFLLVICRCDQHTCYGRHWRIHESIYWLPILNLYQNDC